MKPQSHLIAPWLSGSLIGPFLLIAVAIVVIALVPIGPNVELAQPSGPASVFNWRIRVHRAHGHANVMLFERWAHYWVWLGSHA
jgi:hypothetical protein